MLLRRDWLLGDTAIEEERATLEEDGVLEGGIRLVAFVHSPQHEFAPPVWRVGVRGLWDAREVVCGVLVVREEAGIEAALAAGEIACSCGGRLARWGFCRERVVRTLDGNRRVRPRRAICRSCGRTHALIACYMVPRRRDGADVIARALLAKARGDGHRKIAQRLGRPATTVRGWLRRFAAIGELVRAAASRWAYALDPQLGPIAPAGSRFADALEAVGVAMRAWALRFGPTSPWPLMVWIAGGLLRAPPQPWPAV